VGIAAGPLVGGVLGSISWRWPFFGVSTLMALALVVITFLLPSTLRAEKATTLMDPLRALKHRGLLGVTTTALLCNSGGSAMLSFAPFPLNMTARKVGLIFFGWGLALAFASVVVAPRLRRRFGTFATLLVDLLAMTATGAVMALGTDNKSVLASCVIVAGLFIGISNTLITETVMTAAPVERGVASAAYSFMRFSGAALAPWLAGVLAEQVNVHAPFWAGAGAVLLSAGVFAATRPHLAGTDAEDKDVLGTAADDAVAIGSDT
jgi:predicted MFS family arabinose efflux permease